MVGLFEHLERRYRSDERRAGVELAACAGL